MKDNAPVTAQKRRWLRFALPMNVRAASLGLLAWALLFSTLGAEEPQSSNLVAASKANSQGEKAEAYRKIFDHASPQFLCALLCNRNPEVRLNAAWETCLSQLKEFEPEQGSRLLDLRDINTDESVYRIPRQAVDAFISRVQQGLGIQVPSFWKTDLIDSWAINGHFKFGALSDSPTTDFSATFQPLFNRHVLHPNDVAIRSQQESLVLQRGRRRIVVPVLLLRDTEYIPTGFSVAFCGNRAFVASFDDTLTCGRLLCIDVAKGNQVWTQPLWGSYGGPDLPDLPRWLTGASGGFDLTADKENVTVFGSSGSGGSIESFAAANGSSRVRLSSSYWERRGAFQWW